ncbi:uncharacterized protein Z520_04778 [Fonsecaea multimorphosa CBS 102226]|uniref:Transcription factor domain-containing protein n=1 Tax=Fonsecaea multimorphosa CBS 102226 TaxID=1442371 RepID=A0A0D2K065_9EURO|nr:uncharacterized protein Z520_04778 [Fonsecaea multimorphosa CBS 102226]KIX99202.1 hypothetical protein Z520_04778 [Fonsecaea multimorphosa CBS 102226]OAL25899.1 hypothetical protein AYO22_04526 [Fonsecaea multimorphosa]
MASATLKIVFHEGPDKDGQGAGLSAKERRAHAARIGHLKSAQGASKTVHKKQPPKYAPQYSPPKTQALYRLNVPKPDRASSSSVSSKSSSSESSRSSDEEEPLTPPSPLVLNGNSDPFTMLPIVITPLVNQCLTFMREALYPSIYYSTFFRRLYGTSHGPINVLQDSTWLPAQTAQQDWGTAASSLHSEGHAMACIASFLSNMAPLMPESNRLKISREALIYTTKSSHLLRQSLDKLPSTDSKNALLRDPSLIYHVFWLFRAAVFSENRNSVAVHGKVLAQSIMQGFNDGVVDHLTIIQAINADCDDATKFMRRTHFDPDWYRTIVQPIWTMAEYILPPVPEALYVNINPTIELPELREIFINSLHQAAYCEDGSQVPDAAWGPHEQRQLAFAWFATQSEYTMSKLLKIYFDLRGGRHSSQHHTEAQQVLAPGQRLTQIGLALGLLFYHRVLGHETKINGQDIRDSSPEIIRHLRAVMQQISIVATEEEQQKYSEAHAWLYFLGAFEEERKGTSPKDTWFRRRLAEHVNLSKEKGWNTSSSWKDYRRIFHSFLYSNWAYPSGSTWFERVVSMYKSPET